ncbi:MAG: ATP-binding protein [Candidatus Enterosoma sp.]|nr:ATP-binding protein [bacterium]MDY5909439.1 ATP-binding protein [Candidatus Enterosoma sp.]
MNSAAKIEAFKSYYRQAKEAYEVEDFSNARELFIKAASLANEISLETTSYDIRMEYHSLAERTVTFLKNGFRKEPIKVKQGEKETKLFEEIQTDDKDKITFADVAGLSEVKNEIIYNVIEPLKNPELAKAYDIKPGAKILLYGPPGTGKTFISRAIAGEVDAKFYSVNCQDLISKYMGESSKQIDALFEEAQKNKKAIIFFDEFDSLAAKRESDNGSVDGEMARFVATFLTKVDGFKKAKDCEMLLLIAATNRPWAIDPAMLRGGRFDIQIYVGLPDKESRTFLISEELKNVGISDADTDFIAFSLKGFGGADVVSACRKIKQLAYRRAIKSKKFEKITMDDIRKVVTNMHPSVSEEELSQFESFKKGVL